MHHPSCPARTGTGPCRCPGGTRPQVPNPLPPKKTPKVKPVPKKNPKTK